MTELVVRDVGLVSSAESLPDLGRAQEIVMGLVAAGETSALDEARTQAEAYALYEKRRGHSEREYHYGVLRLLAEAALGVLSFAEPSIIEQSNRRSDWRALAAVLERGALVRFLADRSLGRLSTTQVAYWARREGYTYAPGSALGVRGSLRWRAARDLAAEKGVPLSDIPPDPEYVQRRDDSEWKLAREQHRRREAYRRFLRSEALKGAQRAAKARGPRTDVVYALLRRTLQALHEAQSEYNVEERTRSHYDGGGSGLNEVFYHLHRAEDRLVDLLGISLPSEDSL